MHGRRRLDRQRCGKTIHALTDRSQPHSRVFVGRCGARCVRKPVCRINQLVDSRAMVPLKQFDDSRQLRAAAWSGRAWRARRDGRGPSGCYCFFQVGLAPAPRVVGKLNASPINALRWRAIGGPDRENSQKQPDNSQTRRSAVKRLIRLRKNLAARAARGPRQCLETLVTRRLACRGWARSSCARCSSRWTRTSGASPYARRSTSCSSNSR